MANMTRYSLTGLSYDHQPAYSTRAYESYVHCFTTIYCGLLHRTVIGAGIRQHIVIESIKIFPNINSLSRMEGYSVAFSPNKRLVIYF